MIESYNDAAGIRHDFAVATFLHPIIHVSSFIAVVANSLLARRLYPSHQASTIA